MLGPRSMDSSQYIQRHRSTKLLIDRYESMGSTPTVPSYSFRGPKTSPSRLVSKRIPTPHKKDKSPIRQSLRNLFSVFRKVNVTGKYKPDESTSAPNRPGPVLSVLTSSSALELKPLVFPVRKHTGALLYLSHASQISSPSPILPVWTTCTATIETNRIVISWLTTHGNPSIHTIQLSNCTDVRSLSSKQLDAGECALLPTKGDTEELKVFEILFEGRTREKFAATSVRERAEWVSAIWDAVLPSQEPSRENRGLTEQSFDTPCRSESVNSSTMLVPPSTSPGYRERSLPPIPMVASQDLPVHTPSQRTHWQGQSMPPSPVSPSVYATSRPSSRTSTTGTQSRSNSPSIANLGRLSVVKQRLAQIERNSSQTSSSGLTSPMWSPQSPGYSSCTTTHSLNSREQGKNLDGLKPQRSSSVRSNIVDSILSSYGDVISISNDASKVAPHVGELKEDFPPSWAPPDSGFPPATMTDGLETLHDRSYCLSTNPDAQAPSLQHDGQDCAQELAFVMDREADTANISKTISKLDQRTKVNGEIIRSIEARTIAAEERQKTRDVSSSNDASSILQALQLMRQHLATDFPVVLTTLNQIQAMGRDTQAMSMSNANTTHQKTSPAIDLSALHAKLDDLLVGCNAAVANNPTTMQIVPLLEEVKNQASLQAQQQADSLRYLNELNTWLEAFVNNGTSHIHELVASVDKLSQDLGCNSQRLNDPANGASNLLTDVRQLILTMQARDQGIMALQTSVDGLCTKLDVDPNKTSNVEIIADMIDRQRQDQENLFRSLTSEISDEIKGERLRFVEAMKEATAINVQIHVEQFKEELTREVLGMTHEVGRLHRERQAVQNQIADLFAFYTKQKQAGEASLPIPVTTAQVPPQHPFGRSGPHRPLPLPRRT